SAIGRRTPVQIPVHGDVGATLRALLPKIDHKPDRDYLDKWLKRHRSIMTKSIGAYTQDVEDLVPIHPEYVASVLDEVAADDAIFSADTGMCNVWAARYLTPNGRRRFLASSVHGSMANAVPHCIGAQLSHPDRQVVSLSGDGGLSMLLSELITVGSYRIPVKIVVFDNSTLGMVKAEMLVDGLPDYGVDTPQVDFRGIAAAAGIDAQRVDKPGDVRGALERAMAVDGPALGHVITDPRALSMPPTVTGAQLKGFALAMSKVVVGGGMGEAVNLARLNLRNIPRPCPAPDSARPLTLPGPRPRAGPDGG